MTPWFRWLQILFIFAVNNLWNYFFNFIWLSQQSEGENHRLRQRCSSWRCSESPGCRSWIPPWSPEPHQYLGNVFAPGELHLNKNISTAINKSSICKYFIMRSWLVTSFSRFPVCICWPQLILTCFCKVLPWPHHHWALSQPSQHY